MYININYRLLKLRNSKTPADHEHFDYEISLENPSESPLVRDLLHSLGIDPNMKDSEHLAVILANLIRDLGRDRRFTAITMAESKIPRCVNGFDLKRTRIKSLVLAMRDKKLLDFHIGSRDKETGRRLRTKIRATPKLIDLILSRSPVNIHLVRPVNREPLKMRGTPLKGEKKGDFIDYKETEQTRRMRRRLVRYNQLLATTPIYLDPAKADPTVVKETDFSETFTYRVFSEGHWNRGGRFYGGWWVDRIPSEERRNILINGEPTVEIDFCSQALVLLYALEGVHFGDAGVDGYALENAEGKLYVRNDVKDLFTIALNSTSANSTISAFMRRREREELQAQEDGEPLGRFPRLNWGECREMLRAFRACHPKIAKYLFKGKSKGLYLQYLDSQIADEILRVMTKAKIPVLCVHDSFIVAVQHEEKLLKAMANAFAKTLKNELGFTARGLVSLKRTSGSTSLRFQVEVSPASRKEQAA